MPDIWMDVDAAVTVPTNVVPLVDRTDGATVEINIAYNEAGMNIAWNFCTPAGVMTTTAFTPTTAGVHDWSESGTDEGMYKVEIPASAGTVNNNLEGTGWISGETTASLPFRGPYIGFRAAGLNNVLIEDAYSTTRGLSGTALPAVAAEGAGGLYTRGTGAGQIDQSANGRVNADAVAISGSAQAADNAEEGFESIVTGTAGGASTTTNIVSGLTTTSDQFNGKVLTFKNDTTTQALRGQTQKITATDASGNLTVIAFSTAATSGTDTYIIT